jgi:hypothetical protein
MLTFSILPFFIYTLPSCTCPVWILQPLLINQDQSGAAKACVGPNLQVQEILKNCINRSQASDGQINQSTSQAGGVKVELEKKAMKD